MLVAIEGIDGSGKSTLAKEVAKLLRRRGKKVVLTQEPTTSALGRLVRKGIREHYDPLVQAGLFLTDRAWHVLELAPHLARGDVVLTDRYVDSTTAYQAAALNGRIPNALSTLRSIQSVVFPRPDLVVLLDIEPRAALRRIRGRAVKEQYEKQRFLARVRANYRAMAKEDGKGTWLVLDATLSVKELALRVAERIVAVRKPRT